jgi:hypothetical protein
MLSYWSDDDSDQESMTDPDPENETDDAQVKRLEVKELEKEADRKRREEDRQKVLEQAGLKLRREAPGVPVQRNKTRSRRKAPAAPAGPAGAGGEDKTRSGKEGGGRRRPAPTVPPHKDDKESEKEEKLDTLDAYARYENYLAQSQAKATTVRAIQAPTPTSPTPSTPNIPSSPPTPTGTRPGRSASLISQPSSTGGGGRFSGLISRIMAPSTSTDSHVGSSKKSIQIVRVDSQQADSDSGVGGDTASQAGGTWTSLVESSVLETMSEKERKRQEVSLSATFRRLNPVRRSGKERPV